MNGSAVDIVQKVSSGISSVAESLVVPDSGDNVRLGKYNEALAYAQENGNAVATLAFKKEDIIPFNESVSAIEAWRMSHPEVIDAKIQYGTSSIENPKNESGSGKPTVFIKQNDSTVFPVAASLVDGELKINGASGLKLVYDSGNPEISSLTEPEIQKLIGKLDPW